jgi:hypothetical protein
MSKKLRDFIFNSFVVIFVIATVFLSLYASGYKFNFKRPIDFNRILVRTGMIDIKTEPKDASIYLNGKIQPTPSLELFKKEHLKTPAKIRNVIPGEYNISLEKEGYWPYQEKIYVHSGQTTILENINLYKSSNPSLKAITKENSNKENIIISPDNNYIFLKDSKEIINLENEEIRDISEELNNENDFKAKWCNNGLLFINGIFFSPKNQDKDLDYSSLIGKKASNWKYSENLNRIYYKHNNSLNYFDISNKQVYVIINNINFIDYFPEEKHIFLVSIKEDNNYYLSKYNLEENKIIQEITLPKNADYVFGDNNVNYLSLLDKQNKTLYFINKEEIDKGTRKISFVNDWQWADEYTVFFINDWEINMFNLKNGEKYLINRFSKTLNNIILNSKENYIIVTDDKNIRVVDLKNNYNTTLLKADVLHSPVLDTANNYLYFWSKLKKGSGVYRIEVK